MNVDLLFENFLNNPYIKNNITKLKTSVWRTLSDEEKLEVYDCINRCFCSFLNTEFYNIKCEDSLYVDYIDIDGEEEYTNNIASEKNRTLKIKDINYNQYHTLYEYFYKVISDYQRKVVASKKTMIDAKTKAKWKKDLDVFTFGSITVKTYDDEDIDYSSVVLDAKKYCFNIVMGMVKKNFDYFNSYDEEKFVSCTNLIENKDIVKLGKENARIGCNENLKIRDTLANINERFKYLNSLDDLSSVPDRDIFMVVYPNVSDNIDLLLMIKLYNEILNRIYDGDISLAKDNKKISINNHLYSYSKFRNYGFNIVLYECLNMIEKDLKNNKKFLNSKIVKDKGLKSALIEAKREWVETVVSRIDCSLMFVNFGVLKHQPLQFLFNDKNLSEYLEENTLTGKKLRR